MGPSEHTIEVAGASTFYRDAPSTDRTTLYLHSVPTSSEDWLAFLERTGGIAPDLLGFGGSSKAGHLEYTLPGYVDFLEGFLSAVEVQEVDLVGHGWGAAIGLAFAQRHPGSVGRLAIIDAVPLLDGFEWPRLARRWRRPGLGELLMGSVNQRLFARTLRAGACFTDADIDRIWEQFDQGTQRAILRLHRSLTADELAAAGAGLGELEGPALVIWGERDPWLEPAFGAAYAERLRDAQLERVPDAGHWPWIEEPAVIERVAAFLSERR